MDLLVLADDAPHEVLPALELLPHRVQWLVPGRVFPDGGGFPERTVLPACDTVLVDARARSATAAVVCARIRAVIPWAPVIGVFSELVLRRDGIEGDIDELILAGAGPAEIEARLRLARPRPFPAARALVAGDLLLDDTSCTARLGGRVLDLTRREYQLLRHLVRLAGETVSRTQLLAEIWDGDTVCTERTVDVHILRLRAKLGPEHRRLIRTARGRGYKLVANAGLPEPGRTSECPL